MEASRLFHVSEEVEITVFKPRPSPSYFPSIERDVVFAISDTMLHNYLLPRECPRVCFYAGKDTYIPDIEHFMGPSSPSKVVVAVEARWMQRICSTTLYCYEFSIDRFVLLDSIAGYYISYEESLPLQVMTITNPIYELCRRNVELRVLPELLGLAEKVQQSSLAYSLIRLRNAARTA